MENENPFPKIDLFPKLTRVGHFIGRLVSFCPLEAPDYMSEHYRGGAALLDRELYDKPTGQLELFDDGK